MATSATTDTDHQIEEHVEEELAEPKEKVEDVAEQKPEGELEDIAEHAEEEIAEQRSEEKVEEIAGYVLEEIEEHVQEELARYVLEEIEEHVLRETAEQRQEEMQEEIEEQRHEERMGEVEEHVLEEIADQSQEEMEEESCDERLEEVEEHVLEEIGEQSQEEMEEESCDERLEDVEEEQREEENSAEIANPEPDSDSSHEYLLPFLETSDESSDETLLRREDLQIRPKVHTHTISLRQNLRNVRILSRRTFWGDMNPPVRKIIKVARAIPLVFAFFAVILSLIIPEIRQILIQRSMLDRGIIFICDACIFLILGYTFGFAKMPINYTFIMITKQFSLSDNDNQLLTSKPSGITATTLFTSGFDKPYQSLVAFAGFTIASTVLTKCTKIKVARANSLVLLGTLIIPMIGTVVLLSSLCMDYIGGPESHLGLCRLWFWLACLTSAFVSFSVFQRLVLRSNINYKFAQQLRAHLEIIFHFLHMYYVGRYVLLIHPKFLMGDTNTEKIAFLARWLIPKEIFQLWNYTTSYF